MQPRQGTAPIAQLPATAEDLGLSSEDQSRRICVEDAGVVGSTMHGSGSDIPNTCGKRFERIPETFVLDDGDEAESEYFPDYSTDQREFFIPAFSDGEVDDIIGSFCQKLLECPVAGDLPLAGPAAEAAGADAQRCGEAEPPVLPDVEPVRTARCERNRARRRRRRLLALVSSLAVKPEHERTDADRDAMMKSLTEDIGPGGAFDSIQQFVNALMGSVSTQSRPSSTVRPPRQLATSC